MWIDVLSPVQELLAKHGIHEQNFRERIAELRQHNRRRVVEGDRDHLIYYALQSTAFTKLPPIEPALSAEEFIARGRIPPAAQARLDAFAAAARTRRDHGPRMTIFREMLARESINLPEAYGRAMKSAAPIGAQYQTRGLSTDTSVDAGYAVYLSLAALRRLEADRRIHSVLIVGPGMDLAPRTGFFEGHAPQSYQPFAVIDALIATGLSQRATLRVTGADINPRVVDWLTRARGTRPTLTLLSGIQERGRVQVSDDYREYFATLGRTIGMERPLREAGSGRLGKSIGLAPGVTDSIDATSLDITIERLVARYDLIVVTNVFPYLSDPQLLLAISNVAGMMNPGGVLIHNEPRPVLADALLALGMPLLQSRSAIIANVEGGGAPLYDSVWMHRAP